MNLHKKQTNDEHSGHVPIVGSPKAPQAPALTFGPKVAKLLIEAELAQLKQLLAIGARHVGNEKWNDPYTKFNNVSCRQ